MCDRAKREGQMPYPTDEGFGSRFAAELARLSEGRVSVAQAERVSLMSKAELVQKMTNRLSWHSSESVALLSSRGPEEFARAVVREQVRESGEPKDVSERF